MTPTPEMIEAACDAYANGDPNEYPSESGVKDALTAALALLPGEPQPELPPDIIESLLAIGPVEWGQTYCQSDEKHIEDFADSLRITREFFGIEAEETTIHYVSLAGTSTILAFTGNSPNSPQNARILAGAWNQLVDIAKGKAASPAPLPVAVKARPSYDQVIDVVLKNLRRMHDAGESHRMAARWISEDLDKLYVASPVGGTGEEKSEKLGRFGHHPDPAIDFCVEVEAIEGEFFNLSVGFENGTPSRGELAARVEKAMSFRVGGDENAVLAKETLRGIDAKLRSSPTPASDIAALREENERLKKALLPFANDAGIYDGQPIDDCNKSFNDNITVGDIRRARSALQHVAKGEQG